MILLTGGSGFIGWHFRNMLGPENLVNFDLVPPVHQPSHHEFIQGDIRKKDDLVNAFSKYKIKSIISLAAKHHDFGIGHDEYFDTNEDGTRVLCEVASSFGIEEIVFFSSVAVYGASSELVTPMPDTPYGRSKLAGEQVLHSWARENQERRVTILRPALVFGPHNKANMYNLIRQIDSGFYFHVGKADNIKSVAYVENVIGATLFLTKQRRPGVSIYNYADEPQLTSRQIADSIANALGKRIALTMPVEVAVLMGLPFDFIIKLTGRNLPISSARIRKLSTTTHFNASKIFADGYIPEVNTVEGLKKMVDWYRSVR